MAQPSVTVLFNLSSNDVVCSNPAGDANFSILDTGDKLVWRSAQRLDGDTYADPKYPVVRPVSGSKEAEKTFMIDSSANKYEQIPLAGTTGGGQSGGNTRYVFAAYVDGATEAAPYLECWNTSAHLLANGSFLGGGTPANSLIRAIATTNGAPGSATWTGTPLSGEDSRVALDTGALTGAKYLYWNCKLYIPSTFTPAQSSVYVTAIRILYS
jgi:hypothetical protein